MEYIRNIREHLRFPYPDQPLLGVLFFIVLFVPLVFTNYLNDNVELPKLVLWLLSLCAAVVVWFRQGLLRVKYDLPVLIILGLFWLWALFSTVTSLDPLTSILGLYGRLTSSVLFYGMWALTVILLISAVTRDTFIFLLKTLVIVSGVIAVLGIAQNWGFAYYGGINAPVRPLVPSFLGNPNFSAMFIASVLPFALWFSVRSDRFRSRIYYVTVSLLVIIALALFSSRGASLAALIELAVVFAMSLRHPIQQKRLLGTYAAALVVLGFLVLAFLSVGRPAILQQTLQLSETTVDQRFLAWNESLEMILQRPWTGTGPGNYFIGFNINGNPVFGSTERFDDAHNVLLHLAVNGGLPLMIIFIALIGLALWYGWRAYMRTGDVLYVLLLSATVGWIVSSSFNPVVLSCWLLLAVFIAGLLLDRAQTGQLSVRPWGIMTIRTVSSAVAVIALAWITAEHITYRTIVTYREGKYEQSSGYAQWALRLNPTDTSALTYLAGARVKLKQNPEETDRILNRLVRLHPRSARLNQVAGTIYYQLYRQTGDAQYAQSARSLTEASVRLQPNQVMAYGHAAYLFYKLEDRERATEYTRKVLVLSNKQFYSWVLLAQLYRDNRERDRLLFALEQAYKLEPSQPLIKKTVSDVRAQSDIDKIVLPISFPDPNI